MAKAAAEKSFITRKATAKTASVAHGNRGAQQQQPNATYSGPPGPSLEIALRARQVASEDQDDLHLEFDFGAPLAPESDVATPLPADGSPSSPVHQSPEMQEPAKARPKTKRGGAGKKRRAISTGGDSPTRHKVTTRPQPFSFSTDTRKGRRVRPAAVQEDGLEDSRAKTRGVKLRAKYVAIVPVPTPASSAVSSTDAIPRAANLSSGETRDNTGQLVPVPPSTSSTAGIVSGRARFERVIVTAHNPSGIVSDGHISPCVPTSIPVANGGGVASIGGRGRHFERKVHSASRPILAHEYSCEPPSPCPSSRGSYKQARAQEDRRTVSFEGGLSEVLQFNVEERSGSVPPRVARRVFGGDLQVGGVSSGSTVSLRNQGMPLPSAAMTGGRVGHSCSVDRLPTVPGLGASIRPGIRDLNAILPDFESPFL